jgi:hypothetical protein
VAVGLERAHAQLLGQGQSLAVVSFSELALRGIALHGDLAEEEQDPGLAGPFVMLASQLEGTLGVLARLLSAPSQERGLAQIDPPE